MIFFFTSGHNKYVQIIHKEEKDETQFNVQLYKRTILFTEI